MIPAGYHCSRIYKGMIRKSGSYSYVKIYTDGDNYIFVSGEYDACCTDEPMEIDITISSPTPIGNAP